MDEDRPAARGTDPDTSWAAWKSIEPTVAALRMRVLTSLRVDGAQTTGEIAARLGAARDSISPRMAELHDRGLVVDTGLRRLMDSNRRQIVWRHAEEDEMGEVKERAKPRKLTPLQKIEALLEPAQRKLEELKQMKIAAEEKLAVIQHRISQQERDVNALEATATALRDR